MHTSVVVYELKDENGKVLCYHVTAMQAKVLEKLGKKDPRYEGIIRRQALAVTEPGERKPSFDSGGRVSQGTFAPLPAMLGTEDPSKMKDEPLKGLERS